MKLISIALFLSTFLLIAKDSKKLKYIAFGDSYTICTGTNSIEEQWPTILTKHLNQANIATELVANPSKNGYTTQNVIDKELPILNTTNIDFATLLIGVNDWVRGVDINTYHKNLNFIIDHIQKHLTNKKQLILITIPDFGVTPQGAMYSNGRNISEGINAFNDIIKSEAKKRELMCVDIFPLTQLMKINAELIAVDGLHPSAKEYALWEPLILSKAKKLLKK